MIPSPSHCEIALGRRQFQNSAGDMRRVTTGETTSAYSRNDEKEGRVMGKKRCNHRDVLRNAIVIARDTFTRVTNVAFGRIEKLLHSLLYHQRPP